MPYQSATPLLVLHGLRLKGAADAAVVAANAGLAVGTVERQLAELARGGLVTHRSGLLPGWALTVPGRREHERRLARELEAAGARPAVEAGYRQFRELNPVVLQACSGWQVRELAGRLVPNDHRDPVYDERIVDDLGAAVDRALPAVDKLAGALARYRPHGSRLVEAMGRVRGGDGDYVAKPLIPSVHTVWFELHEDLLATLGLERSSEEVA